MAQQPLNFMRPSTRARGRVPPTVCLECLHHGTKDRSLAAMSGGSVTGIERGDTPVSARECLWFQTQAGRAASQEDRMLVITASVNGGRGCTMVERS